MNRSRSATGAPPPPLDLNLLVTFEALWLERSVTRAGRKLGLSQPATSGALARLREMVGDVLFIRKQNVLEPTARCIELAVPLTRALVELRNALAGTAFEPQRSSRLFRIGAVDAALAVFAPRIVGRALAQAPLATLELTAINPVRAVELLDAGALDLALSPVATSSATVRLRKLFKLDFVIGTRVDHP